MTEAQQDLKDWLDGKASVLIDDIFQQIKETENDVDKQIYLHGVYPEHIAAFETWRQFGYEKCFKEWRK